MRQVGGPPMLAIDYPDEGDLYDDLAYSGRVSVRDLIVSYGIVLLLAAAVIWLLFWPGEAESMERCQRLHSFETCFHALHR